MTDSKAKRVKEYDVFKDSLIRYLGYANEVGEAFRVLVPVSVVNFSYVVASGYVVADSLDKGYKVWKKNDNTSSDRYRKVGIATADTLIWQAFASVIIPGFTINRVCWLSRQVLGRVKSLPQAAQKWGVVAIGLSSIPFIVRPIDQGTDLVMDSTIRRLPFWDH